MKGDVATVFDCIIFDCGDYSFSIQLIKDGVEIRLEDRPLGYIDNNIIIANLNLFQVKRLIATLVAMREKLRGQAK